MKKIMFENIKISLLNIKLNRFCQLLKTSHLQWRIIIAIMCSILLPGQKSQAQIYVDVCASGFFENGTMLFPYKTLAKAVEHAKAFPGSNIIMKGGVYAESLTISNVVTITAYDGSALIGGYNVGWRDVSLVVSSGKSTNARVYYPSMASGANTQMATSCDGGFPAVVYAHGRRSEGYDICDSWTSPGSIQDDYLQIEGILNRLVASGVIAISFDWNSLSFHDYDIAGYVIDAITHLGNEFGVNVNLQNIGLMGHSTGGAAVIIAAERLRGSQNPRIKAVGLIAPSAPLHQAINMSDPVLVIHGTREHPCMVGLMPLEIYCESAAPKHLVVLEGANHYGYTDGICLDPQQTRSGECLFDLYGLDPRDFLPYAPGWDNSSEVGGKTGKEAHGLQQLAAGNYLLAFFSYYLQNNSGAIDYLMQRSGKQCGYPGSPQRCQADLLVSPSLDCVPVRYFDDLQSSNVVVNVCSCLD